MNKTIYVKNLILWNAVADYCTANGISISEFIETAMRNHLKQVDDYKSRIKVEILNRLRRDMRAAGFPESKIDTMIAGLLQIHDETS